MVSSKTIHLLITGGTIDSHYEGAKDTVIPHKHSIIPKYLKSIRSYDNFKFTEVCMKDSREINRTDLKKIYGTINKSPYKRILITHGTYTMPDTARYLANKLKRKDQKIILTGSMVPLDGFNLNDAAYNLGYAIASFENVTPGVYLCMNGKIFNAEESTKILAEGRFVSLFSK